MMDDDGHLVVPMKQRYAQLHVNAALTRRHDYSQACKELACILRKVYAEASKAVQLTIHEDVLLAFRLLPEMDTFEQLSAAELLLQAVEATFRKKRRIAAVSEYKQAAVAQHRRARHQESEKPADYVDLPIDLLVKIFGFLDPRSLAISSAVCRIWNEAANEDGLWCTHFFSMFGGPYFERKSTTPKYLSRQLEDFGRVKAARRGFWRKVLDKKLSRPGFGHLRRLSLSNRVLCMGCKTLFWLSESPGVHNRRGNCKHQQHLARPVSVGKVLDFVQSNFLSSSSSSSDSDTGGDFRHRHGLSRSWAYPKFEQRYLKTSPSSVQKFVSFPYRDQEDTGESTGDSSDDGF